MTAATQHPQHGDPAVHHDPSGRIHLIVLFGGQSAEHDVSCTTAAHVLRAADPAKYDITPIGIGRDGRWSLATAALAALTEGAHALPSRLDATGDSIEPTVAITPSTTGRTVVVPLLHGPLGEDGTVQGMLELADLAYVGSGVLGSAVAMDKAMAKEVTAAHGIPQARHLAVRADQCGPGTPAHLANSLGLPVFVKPANMGSSVGVTKAKTIEAVRDALEVAFSYDEWAVIEEAIDGREIEVAVLGNLQPRASVPGEIVPGAEFYDYADKYLDDGSQALVPAPLTAEQVDEVRALALRAFTALRCEGLSRVDFFFEEGGRGFLLNEVNTMPGFTPISMYPKLWIASGLSYADLIDELVRLAIERHTRRRRNTTH
ncbi:MAG: D-alanine--D-alanine ligase family protein [Actinomycetota bacterium]|nr:D-alanine--D-alanine ligase family protein [Actinomycetota bacterium]